MPWPLFLSILLSEEEYYRNLLYNSDKLPKQLLKTEINNTEELIEEERVIKNYENEIYSFLKYSNFSCRFDSYMLIQIFIFNKYYEILNNNNNKTTKNEKALEDIDLFIYSLNDNDLKKGFWQILEDNENKLDVLDILTNNRGYK